MTLRVLADSVLATGLRAEGGVSGSVLAYLPSPAQGVWHLGPLPLRAYALCIIVGIIVAIWWGERRWRDRGGQPGAILDVAMFAVPFGLIGGRLYHVATDWQKYFGADGNPMDAFKIYQGGLGIWGAVLLGGVGAWIGCRVYRIPLPALGDALAPPILLAQAIGRIGNYFNQELYGRDTDLPWGLEIYRRFDDNGKLDMMNGVSTGQVDKIVHPTFLYELIWNVLIVLVLVWLDKRYRLGHGRLFALYVAGYCFGRFFVELMRDDEATKIAGIRINSFTSALVFLAALAYVIFAKRGREAPEELQPGGVAADSAAVPEDDAEFEDAAFEDAAFGDDTAITEEFTVVDKLSPEHAASEKAVSTENSAPDAQSSDGKTEPEGRSASETESVSEAETVAAPTAESDAEVSTAKVTTEPEPDSDTAAATSDRTADAVSAESTRSGAGAESDTGR